MKLTIEDSANYAASIIRIPAPFKMPNSDRLYGVNVFGMTAIVDDSWVKREGELAVFFPAESQISEGFAASANLYRHTDLNNDPTQSGYLEDNRRVRSLKLRGNVSNGLILPLYEVTVFTGEPQIHFSEGDVFDTINGVEISRKYRVKIPQAHDHVAAQMKKAFRRVDATMLPEHIETAQWLRNEQYFTDDDVLIVTQKLHGTSVRLARTIVKRKLKWYDSLAKRLGVKVAETEYDAVAGSRRAVKDPNNPDQKHFYGEDGDVWTEALRAYESAIPSGVIVYGELIGWTKMGGAIQKGFTYDVPEGEAHLYVYRVTTISPDGLLIDLSWDQVRGFCAQRGINTVPELWRGFKRDFDVEAFEETNFSAEHWEGKRGGVPAFPDEPVPLSKGGTGKDEGIAIRIDRDGLNPLLFKVKNKSFYLHETELLDAGEVDTEEAN